MSVSRTGLATLGAALGVAAASAQPISPQDIIAHTRLQDLMRQCQQQAREEVPGTPEQQAQSREFHDAAMECLRDNRAWYPVGR
ncbi:MAG: hypothetical protein ACJ8BC_03210 [Gemmatimonadales bacterium]